MTEQLSELTYKKALLWGTKELQKASESPDLDARVLMEHASGLDRAHLVLHADNPIPLQTLRVWQKMITRRTEGEPVAYLTGHKEFYGLDFFVSPGILVPRPDTEVLVEAGLEYLRNRQNREDLPNPRILDLCTGSGCVALSILTSFPCAEAEVWASDISPLCVETAKKNHRNLVDADEDNPAFHAKISDLFLQMEGRWDLVVSNPPYLTPAETKERIEDLGWKEPALALEGFGIDGLELIRKMIKQAVLKLNPNAGFYLEASPAQMNTIEELMKTAGLKRITRHKDISGQERVIGGIFRPKE